MFPIKRIFIAVLLLISYIACFAQTKHALLIGIGDYPASSGWSKIHGNRDIPIIRETLLKQGFQNADIVQLVDAQATKSAIVSSFESLAKRVGKGDVVYIHFSGHGQQITDLNGDEDDMFDEAWIPFDACKEYKKGVYEGEKHLIDDEVNKLIMSIRESISTTGKIVVVLDACHSGSSTRGNDPDDEDDIVRGGGKFILPSTANRVAIKTVEETRSNGEKNIVSTKAEKLQWLSVAACKDHQSNHEYRDEDGKWCGILTYIISKDTRTFSEKSYTEIVDDWKKKLDELSEYPQNLKDEGKPSKSSKTLF